MRISSRRPELPLDVITSHPFWLTRLTLFGNLFYYAFWFVCLFCLHFPPCATAFFLFHLTIYSFNSSLSFPTFPFYFMSCVCSESSLSFCRFVHCIPHCISVLSTHPWLLFILFYFIYVFSIIFSSFAPRFTMHTVFYSAPCLLLQYFILLPAYLCT